jgi:hypothetical protein
MGNYAPKNWKSMEIIYCANEGCPNAAIIALESDDETYAFCLQALYPIKEGSEVTVTETDCKPTVNRL